MASKAELLEQAKAKGLDVKTGTTKSELESMLNTNNENGEKTNGTTKDGDTSPVTHETSVPQNGATEVETDKGTDNEVAVASDEARTEEEVKFADESNPNQKARDEAAPGEEVDQDGNPRTGGYSYGVAASDTTGVVPEESNKGKEAEDSADFQPVKFENAGNLDYLNDPKGNPEEWSIEKQRSLEDSLSEPKAGIRARVTTSAGKYVRIKFFYNNKPLGTYTSRDFKEADARKHLSDLRKHAEV